jgi:hypothetical protein
MIMMSLAWLCCCCSEVQELKEELAMMELMTGWQQQQQQQDGADSSSRQPYNDAQRQKLQQLVTSWLQIPGDADSSDNSCSILTQLPLSSVRQLRELLLAVKVGGAAHGYAHMQSEVLLEHAAQCTVCGTWKCWVAAQGDCWCEHCVEACGNVLFLKCSAGSGKSTAAAVAP